MTTSDERYVEMREFLRENLARELTEKELHFVAWLSDYEMVTYDQIIAFFAELVEQKEQVEVDEFRTRLTAGEESFVLKQYAEGESIEKIRVQLEGNVAQKALRDLIAEEYGKEMMCERCGRVLHIQHRHHADVRYSCVSCGRVPESELHKLPE